VSVGRSRPFACWSPSLGEEWLHEPKLDGYRFQVVKNGRQVRLFSRSGAEYGNAAQTH
jgi:ATP-dependent DNA ligase